MDIVLIAGLWLDPSAWDRVVPELTALGHRPVAVALPGQVSGVSGSGDGASSATLDDQLAAVLAAVDAAPGKPLVVGHSAASALAWLAADARPDRVAGVVLIGGFPSADGEPYAPNLPVVDGAMPFPGWAEFDGPDSADLDEDARRRLAASAIPVPVGVARATVHLTDDRRYDVPVTLICPEFTPAQVREWVAAGELPELTRAKHVDYVDLDSGHWPMFTRPAELARLIQSAGAG